MTFTFVTTKCQKEKNAPNKKEPEYTMTSNFHHSKSEIYFIIKRWLYLDKGWTDPSTTINIP